MFDNVDKKQDPEFDVNRTTGASYRGIPDEQEEV